MFLYYVRYRRLGGNWQTYKTPFYSWQDAYRQGADFHAQDKTFVFHIVERKSRKAKGE